MIAEHKAQVNARLNKIKENIPTKFFYDKSFDTSFRNKILSEIKLDYTKVDKSNMLACSPLLNREQEHHLFRKYNYLKYRILKSTIGFEPSDIKPYPKPSKPVKLDRLGEKSLIEIERLITQAQDLRNLLLKSNLRLIIKQLSKYCPNDSYERDEFFSNGYCHVLKAIECFDYRRGFKFSTYCVNALISNLRRDNSQRRRLDELLTSPEDYILEDKKEKSYSEVNQKYNRRFIDEMLKKIKKHLKNPEVKIKVVRGYYGLDGVQKNLHQLAQELNLSRERIRQIKLDTMKCLSTKIAKEMVYDPLI